MDEKDRQKALKGLHSMAMNRLRRIELEGFTLGRMLVFGVPQARELHFHTLCKAGHSVSPSPPLKNGSIPWGVESRDMLGNTPN